MGVLGGGRGGDRHDWLATKQPHQTVMFCHLWFGRNSDRFEMKLFIIYDFLHVCSFLFRLPPSSVTVTIGVCVYIFTYGHMS